LYLKTAIVGKNDNTLPLTDGEIKVWKEAGVIPHRPADCWLRFLVRWRKPYTC
jgi:hypothetical protein